MVFKLLTTEEQWKRALPLWKQLRSDLCEKTCLSRRQDMLASGYLLFGLFDDSGKLVSLASAIIYPHVTRGLNLWIHDLVSDKELRSRGYGEKLMHDVEEYARSKKCSRVCVHTDNTNTNARRFYGEKCGYDAYARVFQKDLNGALN